LEKTNYDSGETVVLLGAGIDPKLIRGLKHARMVITSNLSTEFEAKEEGIPAIFFHRFVQSKKVWESFVNTATYWLENWPTKPIFNKKSIIDIFSFEDTSLWWFNNYSIWETKNGIFDTLYHLIAFSTMIEDSRPKNVEIWGDFDFPILEILNPLSQKYDFKIKTKNYNLKIGNLGKFSESSQQQLIFLIRFLLLKFASIFSRKNSKPQAFFLNHGHVAVKKNVGKVGIIIDHYLEGFEKYFIKNKDKIKLISNSMPRLNSSFVKDLIIEFVKTVKGDYKPWISYYSFSEFMEWKKLVKYYQNKILELEKDPSFKNSMVIDEINIYPLVINAFRGTLPRALAFVRMELKVVRRFLDKEHPDVVFSTDGLNPTGRAISFACKERNIKNISPQLGVMSTKKIANTVFFINENFDKRVLPTYLVWGSFYENLIIDMGYPKSLIKKVGFWRLDKEDMKISNDDNYVLYIAAANLNKLSYILSFDEEIVSIKKIYENIPKHLKLVVKLHPSQPYNLYFKTLRGLKRLMVVGGFGSPEITKIISGARVVVGKASTAIMQALIMEKPVILINFGSELNFLGIDGVPFVTTPKDFGKTLDSILTEGNVRKHNLENYCEPLGNTSLSLIFDEIKQCIRKH